MRAACYNYAGEISIRKKLKLLPGSDLIIGKHAVINVREDIVAVLQTGKEFLFNIVFLNHGLERFKMLRITSYNVCYTKLLRAIFISNNFITFCIVTR